MIKSYISPISASIKLNNNFLRLFSTASLTMTLLAFFAVVTEAADGDLDSSFGAGGKVITSFGTSYDFASDVAIQTDGKIITVGLHNDGVSGGNFALVRHNTDGSLDATFGAGGKVSTALSGSQDWANAVAIQADGKIVVAGYSNSRFAIVRYNSDGTLDQTFDGDGKVTTLVGMQYSYIYEILIQPDGKLVAIGWCDRPNISLAAVRYNPDGSLDSTFATTGKAIYDFNGIGGYAHGGALQADGKIVIVGESGGKSALVRFNSDGNLDNAFGTGGLFLTPNQSGSTAVARDVAIQPDGNIVVAGNRGGSSIDFYLARHTSTGSLDTTFGSAGTITTPFSNFHDFAFGLSLQADGKIVAAGYSASGNLDATNDFAVARYNTDGTPDTSFGTGGRVLTPVGPNNDSAQAVLIQPDGKVVVAGYIFNGSDYDFGLVRYLTSSAIGVTFTVTRSEDLERSASCTPGDCSLREAINAANSAPTNDTIEFAVNVTAITMTINREIEIRNSGTLNIAGPGANLLTIDGGAGINRIFYTNFATVTISGMKLTGGDAEGTINSFAGGAVLARGGSLTLDGVHITGNTAVYGMGGGALFVGPGSNHRIINSTFSDNRSSSCGGFNIQDGAVAVLNSTFSGNFASSYGGGLCVDGNASLHNVTIANNTADFGGGINHFSNGLTLGNTIVAGNTSYRDSGPEIRKEFRGNLMSTGNNLIGNSIGDSANTYYEIAYHPTDLKDSNPMLGLLQNNGGPTPTHSLLAGSPAIDRVPLAGCKDVTGSVVARDQRGHARPDGPGCDIGSFEGSISPDLLAPVLTLPGDFSVEANSASGAIANYTASANDQVDGDVAVNCAPASGTTFSVGQTTVTCTATDEAGNSATGSFEVTVADTTKPVISNVPSARSVEATAANGSFVTWEGPTAADGVSGNIAVTCSPASGSLFAIGTTEVICTATDQAGNSENASFSVSVIDTTAPTFANMPSNVSAVATSGAGVQVSYTKPTATDGVDGHVAVNCSPATGSTFGHGLTTVSCTATDNRGNATTGSFTVTVSNAPPTANPGGPYSVFEGGTVMLSGTGTDPEGSPLIYAWDLDNDGSFETSGQNVSFSAAGLDGFAGSTRNVRLQVTDAVGFSTVSTVAVGISNVAPTITSVSGPTDPKAINTVVRLSVNYTDPAGTLDGYTVTTEWGDGTVDTNATHAYTAAGVYRVKVSVADEDGGSSAQSTFEYVVIYDPSAGFVTGGGSINSPAGAYIADPTSAGRATFGIVSKYQQGTNAPSGNTEFQFHAGGFQFKSNLYEWLVVSGARAQFRGKGSVNGFPGYSFMLTATDGQRPGGGGVDRFRIKITDANGNVVYDNVPGSSEQINEANPQTLSSGSIIIHSN